MEQISSTILFTTERHAFRRFLPDDAEALYDLNADPEVIRYTGDPPFESVGAAAQFVEEYDHYQQYGFGRWAVISKMDQAFLGWCGLKQHQDYVDLGFRFFRKYWNQGHATEAAKACLFYGFKELGLERIVGRVAQENTASVRVLEKLGMTYWKKDECNGIDDAIYYELSKNQFRQHETL